MISSMQTLGAVPRRRFLSDIVRYGGASAMAAWAGPGALAQTRAPRLVLVFLRGAYDGLSAFVPYADPHYSRLRPTIALAAPGSGEGAALALDAQFGLHPALAPLLPLWQQGVLAFVPAAGSPSESRSHFEAQFQWEIGEIDRNTAPAGWMNHLARLLDPSFLRPRAVEVGEANPRILSGPAPVQRVPRGQAATRTGVLADASTRAAMLQMYGDQNALSQAFQEGVDSRIETAGTLVRGQAMQASKEMMAASNGARNADALAVDAQHLGTLMRFNRQLQIGFLSAGGWDTHANQGAATGQLANNLASLAQALVQLRKDFSEPGDVIAVVSEFGRTTQENGSRGTDHGHGNALWLIGNAVNGGRWHGRWTGLAPEQLHQGRDLPVHHDFREVFSQVLKAQWDLQAQSLAALFPGYQSTGELSQLMRS